MKTQHDALDLLNNNIERLIERLDIIIKMMSPDDEAGMERHHDKDAVEDLL
jgi:hypothetical protein